MPLPANRRIWFAGLLLGLATLAVYWPVRHYGFIDYDDEGYVFNNPTVRGGLSWWGLVWAFVDQHESNWHPLTWLSHMLDCQLFGLNAGAHHLVNVLFHCANAVLLLLLLNAMTGKPGRSAFVAALVVVALFVVLVDSLGTAVKGASGVRDVGVGADAVSAAASVGSFVGDEPAAPATDDLPVRERSSIRFGLSAPAQHLSVSGFLLG